MRKIILVPVSYGIELDPQYCDVIVRRMAGFFKVDAIHAETGKSFAEIARDRATESAVDDQPDEEVGAIEEIV